ncbi:iron-sulfur cluster repair protein YtfE [Rheinheimera sp. 4Y26]|uniref:iron-sulfur cluster repair protein YtfE n=1 Tax=Rheinheimera sp. 4Y26 TaxID=2977811 RepID=UPI0021B0B429|nr:iron-sulfur cluster repair protein YtfE [Rheinheimera sp. 4Y26]MCT6701193.1 iron-sulfur cluster repair protein YtfE [Rheinheimera sp. 4Y26]
MSYLDQPLGQLATQIPGATAVFHKYKLDFCCGGKESLAAAAAKRQLNATQINTELAALALKPTSMQRNWREAKTEELAYFILERFHAKHRLQLPELIRLARRVEHVHADHPECPTGLATHLEHMYQELESHMHKEEQILFPMLCNGFFPAGPISVMQEEHLQHGDALETMLSLAKDLNLPAGACNTWSALYLGLTELKEDLMEHILLENEILFVEPQQQKGQCCGSCQ